MHHGSNRAEDLMLSGLILFNLDGRVLDLIRLSPQSYAAWAEVSFVGDSGAENPIAEFRIHGLTGVMNCEARHGSEFFDYSEKSFQEEQGLVIGVGLTDGKLRFLKQGCSKQQSLPISSVELDAVQPLWGGSNVFLKGDGAIWVQVVQPRPEGVSERRFAGNLAHSEVKELEALLGQHDFPEIKIPERVGVPDESIVRIVAKLRDGRTTSLRTFEKDVHEGFTPIYHWLRVRGERLDRLKQVYEGPNDSSWKPPGF